MALKNTKILREITQTYNRFLSSKSDIPTVHKAQDLTGNIKGNLKKLRYNVSNTTKSPLLPKVQFASKEPEQTEIFEINHLQPSTYPKYIKINPNPRDDDVWQLHKMRGKLNIQYPSATTVENPPKSSFVTETIKGNLLKGPTNVVGSRNYSTSPFMIVSKRYYMRKRHKEGDKCPEKAKKKCPPGPCPSIALKNCEKSPGSHCEHFYEGPDCKKKYCPYKSYSETCAQELEADPSECYQCPWDKCGGAHAIKPPKRTYHTATGYNTAAIPGHGTITKHYHTAVRHHNMVTIPGHFSLVSKQCYEKKKPCKAPPPKCQKKKRKPGCPGEPKKPKKCAIGWTEAYSLWCAKENLIPSVSLDNVEVKRDEKDVRNKFPYDRKQADYEHIRKKQCPNDVDYCKRKKFRRAPEGCQPDPYKRCMPDMEKTIELELRGCPKRKDGRNDCPGSGGPGKKKCPNTYRPIDPRYKPRDPGCREARKNKRYGLPDKAKVFVPEKRKY